MYSQSRPLLEKTIRGYLTELGNVKFVEKCIVEELCASDSGTSITGVILAHRDRQGEQKQECMQADLVIDAGGRGSHAPQWLEKLGYAKVEETEVSMHVGYASRIYRRVPHQASWKLLVILPKAPIKRGGVIFPIENDRWLVTLLGWSRDNPPDDEEGFLAFMRSLEAQDVYNVIKDAEALTPIVTHKLPSNRWRRYERMARFPEGFLVLGDAVCSFNPVYGQGMTVSALEARLLRGQIHQFLRKCLPVAKHTPFLQKKIAQIVTIPWIMATSEDFRYPETTGKPMVGTKFLNWYISRVHELAADDGRIATSFFEVMHMLKHPMSLFQAHILLPVLFRKRKIVV